MSSLRIVRLNKKWRGGRVGCDIASEVALPGKDHIVIIFEIFVINEIHFAVGATLPPQEHKRRVN